MSLIDELVYFIAEHRELVRQIARRRQDRFRDLTYLRRRIREYANIRLHIVHTLGRPFHVATHYRPRQRPVILKDW